MTGLSFLGTGDYQVTNYLYSENGENNVVTTKFFPHALKEIFALEELYVIMTKEAEKKHAEELKRHTNFSIIPIPSGQNEEEIWKMFENIASRVPGKANLLLDVTHGFRSQPMLALSVAIYLRLLKEITIEGIFYGAFEAKDAQNNSPVFNLTPFLDIIDWTFALRRFREKGDADELGKILKQLHTKTYVEQHPYKATSLSGLGDHLSGLFKALSVIRPREVLDEADEILKKVEYVKTDLEKIYQTKPLALTFPQLEENVERFFSPEKANLFSEEGLQVQLNMLDHYLEIGQNQQALTLATELLFSIACLRKGKDSLDHEHRTEIGDRLHAIEKGQPVGNPEKWESELSKIVRLASEYRNDINHAGMRKDPKPAKKIIEKSWEIVRQTKDFINQNF